MKTYSEDFVMIKLMLELTEQNLALFGLAFFTITILALEIGYRGGVFIKLKGWIHHKSEMSGGFIVSGMLMLLAFFLGTALSIANDEYRERQAVVLAEANAIGSAWLIAGAQTDNTGADVQRLLETYTKVRITAVKDVQTPGDELRIVKRTGALQNEIWAKASDIAKRTGDRYSALLFTALNETFDNSVSQREAFDKRIPAHLAKLLGITAILAVMAVGLYLGTLGNRMLVMSTLLVFMFTGAVVLISDLSRPYEGQIRVSPDPLIWTLDSFQPAP
jgi:hypothetical protein